MKSKKPDKQPDLFRSQLSQVLNMNHALIRLHYLKYAFDESDESVVERWVVNPYWQYFAVMISCNSSYSDATNFLVRRYAVSP